MSQRRDFFRQFIGQVGVLRDEIRGVESIPLNRLRELPANIIEGIKPVFFPEETWHLKDRILTIPNRKSEKSTDIELNDIEFYAFRCFKSGMKLKHTAFEIVKELELPFDEVYSTVTSFFFQLASLRICHPKEIYHIDEILKSTREFS